MTVHALLKICFNDAFEGELGWVEQSGIFLKDYVVIAENEPEILVDALFEVNEETLKVSYTAGLEPDENFSFESAFKGEFGWLEESGIFLAEIKK